MATDPEPTLATGQKDADVATGQPSYRGYEYQILATVWLGLELCISRKTDAIIVEPASQEDVAAKLEVPAENATSQVGIGNLQVQIKLRRNTVWKKRDFTTLLECRRITGSRGPAPRERPLAHLRRDASCRFVLVTNADVETALQSFVVPIIDQISTATRLPGASGDDPKLTTRVAILPGQKPDLLTLKIHAILQAKCHVPGTRLDDCLRTLTERVRQRLVGTLANRFPSNEMQEVIRLHGGNVKRPCEPVHPTNFGRIRQQLLEKHALVLVGPPGTGKTTLATSLMAELETGNPPAQRMTVADAAAIESVRRSLNDPHDHVYYFEDPWGQDVPGLSASCFTSELPKLLREAGSGKRFVVTSRLGVFQQAVGARARLFQPYKQELNPKDYDPSSYKELYDRQTADWPPKHRITAREWRAAALKLLETPYSVEIFCQALFDRLEASKRVSDSDVEKLSKRSNVESFGAVLKDRITKGGEDYIRSAVAIWAQLIVTPEAISGDDVKRIRPLLLSGGMANPPDVLKLFNDLADAKWFQPRTQGYITTPSVREALSQFEIDNPAVFEDTIAAMLRGWEKCGSLDNVLLCVQATKEKKNVIPSDIASAFDTFLVQRVLATGSYLFRFAYADVAALTSSAHPVAVLARGLNQRELRSKPEGGWHSFLPNSPK